MANPEGVWRTIGGRRIFIKTGQSVSSAMKESGKFKKATKVKAEGYSHKIDSDYEDRLAKYKEIQKDANKRYDKGEIDKGERNKLIDDAHDKYIKQKEDLKGANREEQKKINKDYIKEQSKLANEKETRNSSERQKALDELREYSGMDADNAETYNAPLEEIKGRTEQLKKEFAKQEAEKQASSKNIVDEVNESNREYAKKKAEEYRNTKDPMFQDIKEERARAYEKQASYKASDLEEGKPYEIDMGNGIKKTAIYLGKDSDGNSAFYDGEGVNGTFAFSDKFVNEKLKVSDNKDDEKFMDLHNQLRNRDSNREHKTKMNSASDVPARIRENSDLAEKIIADDEWNDIHTLYQGGNNAEIVNERTGKRVKITPYDNRETLSKKIEDSYKENKTSSNDWVRDAFNQYKKDHPNTKMTIADFKRNNLK